VGAELVDDILAQGIAQWTRPGNVVVAVDDALPRLCAPVRCNGLLLGYLWLIDTERSLDPAEIDLAEDAAGRAGIVLYRRLILHERSQARHEAILRELVSSDQTARAQAIDDLRAEHLFPDHPTRFRVLAAQLHGDDPTAAVALESAVEEGLRATDDVHLTAANRARAWVLLAEGTDRVVDAVSSRIVARFASLTRGGARIVIGVGTPVEGLDLVVDSYRQAFLAARAALLVPTLGDVARWGRLGPYEVLLKLPVEDLVPAADLPALAELERQDAHGVLMATLEAFFDNAGDVRRTADQLCVHRATLYHRLKRIEEHTGYRLDRGDDRLTLHLGIKLRALAAAYRTQG
jgi:sugar diacid utilization regulator